MYNLSVLEIKLVSGTGSFTLDHYFQGDQQSSPLHLSHSEQKRTNPQEKKLISPILYSQFFLDGVLRSLAYFYAGIDVNMEKQ